MHPHFHHPIVVAILMALFFLGLLSPLLCVVDLTEVNKQIGRALLDALKECRMEAKEIYLPMRYSKAQWSKVIAGEKTLNIARLHFSVPFRFYVAFIERLIVIKARDFSIEQREDAAIERGASHAA